MLLIFYDCYNILNKIYSGGSFIKQALSGTPINEKNRAQITKICYGVLDNDIYLSYCISQLCDKNPKLAVRLLIKMGLYCIKFLQKPPYAVTDAIVGLCKKLGKEGVSGFVNVILRNFVNTDIKLPENEITAISIKYSYPEFILNRLINTYGKDTAIEIASYQKENSFIRFNTGIDGEKYLIENGHSYEKTPFNNCFMCNGIKMDDGFYKGLYTFQSIGSVAICDAVENGENFLDCCAAPGGKSVCLSDKFISVTAFDLHEHRVELIKQYAKRMNKTNIIAYVKDSSVFDRDLICKYDAVLCDAPCSGSGVMRDNPDIKLNRKEADIENLNKTQLAILFAVSNYVKKGGYLYYSTCSVLSEENEKIIEKFLKKNKNYEYVDIENKLNGIKQKYGVQYLPHLSFGAGFYSVKLKRIK